MGGVGLCGMGGYRFGGGGAMIGGVNLRKGIWMSRVTVHKAVVKLPTEAVTVGKDGEYWMGVRTRSCGTIQYGFGNGRTPDEGPVRFARCKSVANSSMNLDDLIDFHAGLGELITEATRRRKCGGTD